jgi:DnaJ family protein C protein 11
VLVARSAVLNLTKEASPADINERHRSLSLIFHPDKQTDEHLKKTAAQEFLKIQKAYQGMRYVFWISAWWQV